jgi:hypothetical protein
MIYGHLADPDAQGQYPSGPFALTEVSFNLEPHLLREVARFLSEKADEIEHGPRQHMMWHRHLSSQSDLWKEVCPDLDVIVLYPQSFVTEESNKVPYVADE